MPLLLASGGVLLLATGGQLLLATDQDQMHIRAPSWRTVSAGTGVTSAAWTAPLDPNGLLDFSMDWADEMIGGADTILESTITLSGQAAAAGLRIYGQSNDDTSVTVWLQVDAAFQNSADWNPPGEVHSLNCRLVTPKGRTHDRTFTFTVRHT
jgi:hypothetical protein